VAEDQPLVEVMTDKAAVTIPSPRRGRVVKLHYQEGEVAKVNLPLLELELHAEEGDGLPDRPEVGRPPVEAQAAGEPPSAPAAAGSAPPVPASGGAPRRALATPAVRAMARQLGIDLSSVEGTGTGGRVTKEDLSRAPPATAPGARLAAERRLPRQVERAPSQPAGELREREEGRPAPSGDEVIPVRGVRRRIAERMAQSKRSAAHFTLVEQVDVTELVRLKERVAAASRERDLKVKVTYLPFIVKAAVAALKQHPWLNATYDEARGEIRLRREYHIGIATATEHGLLVPVIRDADRLSLLGLAREIDRLASAAKQGQAGPADMGGSTFTVTSLGAQGGLFATPIINFPEVAILGVHRIRPTPVVKDGQIVARDVMHVSLSFDHRVVDGHVGAAFAYALVGYLEQPELLFMELA